MSQTICEKCTNQTCLKSGKPCKELNKLLKADGIHSADYIRPKVYSKKRKDGYGKWREIPFSSIKTRDNDGNRMVNG